MAGLYIHIPFCKQACHYCDFHFSTDLRYRPELVLALSKEIELQKKYLENETIQTIYFGGGTPSICNENEIASILEAIHKNFKIAELPEITLEANPDDLDKKKLSSLKKSGINRLSIGIQSFDDIILKFLNRAHSSNEAMECLHNAREAGFDNISLDLIYAIPDQDSEAWKKNIEQALSFSPEHMSCYSLTIEERTVFGNQQRKGKFPIIPDDISAGQFELLMDVMNDAGYDHYEISNFSKPGRHSKHNSSYWQQEKYLGIGPSAHSYDGRSRQANVRNNASYLKSIQKNEIPFELEVLTKENKINEYILTTLRTSWGCNLNKLLTDFGVDLLQERKQYVTTLVEQGHASVNDHVLTLTRSGKLLADKIASDLFSTAD